MIIFSIRWYSNSSKKTQSKTNSDTGEVHYYHSVITPTIVHPDIKKVIPLMQEFISNNEKINKIVK